MRTLAILLIAAGAAGAQGVDDAATYAATIQLEGI